MSNAFDRSKNATGVFFPFDMTQSSRDKLANHTLTVWSCLTRPQNAYSSRQLLNLLYSYAMYEMNTLVVFILLSTLSIF